MFASSVDNWVGLSLAVVAVIIGASVWASLRKEARAGKG